MLHRIDAEKVTGALIADRAVVFSRDSKPVSEEFSFEIPSKSKKEYKILITDLAGGVWKVFTNGKLLKTVEVSESAGTIYFNGSAGKYVITR